MKTSRKKIPILQLFLIGSIIFLGLLLRLFNLEKTAFFDADQENFAWTAVRILQEKRPVLVGLKTGEFPIFIGPLMYYLYSFFLFLFGMDPIGMSYLHICISFLTLISIFYTSINIFGKRIGFLAEFLYTFSFFFIEYDRRVWLPEPLILISMWVFYFLAKLDTQNQSKNLLILGLLFSLGFQLHITVLLFLPIIFLGLVIKKIKVSKKSLGLGFFGGILGLLPIVAFDFRHGFINLKGWQSLLIKSGEKTSYLFRANNLVRYALENLLRVISVEISTLTLVIAGLVFACLGYFAFVKESSRIKSGMTEALRLGVLWAVVPLLVFLPLNLHTPEYYFIISFPIFLMFWAYLFNKILLFFDFAQGSRMTRMWFFLFLTVFAGINTASVFNQRTDGLITLYEKKRAVDFILNKAENKDFSVYYEMDRGFNYGYDYLFYWKTGKVPEKRKDADFTIIVPWNYRDLEVSEKFGGIGIKK